MCVPKEREIVATRYEVKKDVDLPERFYADLWHAVDAVEEREAEAKGETVRQFVIGKDGTFKFA
ncbi:MAG: hypothetical protein HZB44_03795 [Actinobacteria bacterium]|nr:hypothetical protein [Actinomycetota bacterium]